MILWSEGMKIAPNTGESMFCSDSSGQNGLRFISWGAGGWIVTPRCRFSQTIKLPGGFISCSSSSTLMKSCT